MEWGLVPFHDTYVVVVVTIQWSVIFILSQMLSPDDCLCSWWYNSHTVSCMVTLVHSCEKLMHLVLWIKPGAYQLVFSRSFTSAESLSWLSVSCYAGFIYQPKGLVPFLGFWPVCWTGILFQVIHWLLITISPCEVESPWDFWLPRILLQAN